MDAVRYVLLTGIISITFQVTGGQVPCSTLITQMPPKFIIDGTNSNLTLTCDATQVTSGALVFAYLWTNPPKGRMRCVEADVDTNTCTYTPRVEDAGKVATCMAVFLDRPPQAFNCTPDIEYPPQSAPQVAMQPGREGRLEQGDVLTCSVIGGIPLVTSVDFYCTDPTLDDQDDVIIDDVVSSSVTVNTQNASDLNMTCFCSAVWDPQPDLYNDTDVEYYSVQYPPPDSPSMTTTDDQPLNSSSHITCSVEGGDPPVSQVIFTCSNPNLSGVQADIDGVVMSSVIAVDTSLATEENMTCVCSGVWSPMPQYYSKTSTESFVLQYKAHLTSFTFNGTCNQTKVKDTDKATIAMQCQARGRPGAQLKVFRKETPENIIAQQPPPEISDIMAVMTTEWNDDMTEVTPEHTGNYTCVADNGIAETDQKTVELLVTCEPTVFNESLPPLADVSSDGLHFVLQAVPVPVLTVHYTAGAAGTHPQDTLILTDCTRIPLTPHLVACNIVPVKVAGALGLYTGQATNERGTLQFEFNVTGPAPPTTPVAQVAKAADVGAIIGGAVAGGIVLIVIIIIIVVVVVKRRHMGKLHCCQVDEGTRHGDRTSYTHSDTASTTQLHSSMMARSWESGKGKEEQRAQGVENPAAIYEEAWDKPSSKVATNALQSAHTNTRRPSEGAIYATTSDVTRSNRPAPPVPSPNSNIYTDLPTSQDASDSPQPHHYNDNTSSGMQQPPSTAASSPSAVQSGVFEAAFNFSDEDSQSAVDVDGSGAGPISPQGLQPSPFFPDTPEMSEEPSGEDGYAAPRGVNDYAAGAGMRVESTVDLPADRLGDNHTDNYFMHSARI